MYGWSETLHSFTSTKEKMQRKEFLKRLGTFSVAPVVLACNTDEVTPTNASSTGTCTLTATETAGPFPTKNPDNLVMADIRADRTGVELAVKLTIQNKNNGCAPWAGVVVDIWHCDKDGSYSQYGGTGMQTTNYTAVNFLRGRQTTDANGQVGFKTIFPGWYTGRATHIHVHIYTATGTSLLVTQIAFPEGPDSAVNQVNTSTANGYTKGMNGYTANASDNVFSDGVSTELATLTGSISTGFELTHTIVVSP